jgi:endogenous inhibitor of DNA gyrase (YacG/DUF329 family)
MKCPRCESELPSEAKDKSGERREGTTLTPEEALRADTPPAPCPQCGWSTMWNE